MNAAPDFDDRWLDHVLSTPPAAIPDAGFSARVAARIRLRRWMRPLMLGGLGISGVLIALRLTSAEALGALLSSNPIAGIFEAVPMPEAADFANPMVLAILAVAMLSWLVKEAA